jgi:hypothetical protein
MQVNPASQPVFDQLLLQRGAGLGAQGVNLFGTQNRTFGSYLMANNRMFISVKHEPYVPSWPCSPSLRKASRRPRNEAQAALCFCPLKRTKTVQKRAGKNVLAVGGGLHDAGS